VAKLILWTGIVAAVLTPLCALLLSGPVIMVLPLLAVVAGVAVILQKGTRNIAIGAVLGVAGLVLAFLSIPGGVSGESMQWAANEAWSQYFAVLGGALAAAVVPLMRIQAFEPPWLPAASLGAVALALILFALRPEALGNPTGAPALHMPAALLMLSAGAVPFMELRDGRA
jgi:hypothetical protein